MGVIAKRTKSHLVLGVMIGLVFVYPCAFGVSHAESLIWYWLCKSFLGFFVLPVVVYCFVQLRYQEDAIICDSDGLNFATMTPWGRSRIGLGEIRDCSFESIPDEHNHLILVVSEECYQREARSHTWADCSAGRLRFDMMYTQPSMQKVAARIESMLRKSPGFSELGIAHEGSIKPVLKV